VFGSPGVVDVLANYNTVPKDGVQIRNYIDARDAIAGVDCHIGMLCMKQQSISTQEKCDASSACDVHGHWIYGEGLALKHIKGKNKTCQAGKDWNGSTCSGKSNQSTWSILTTEVAAVILAVLVVNMVWS